MMDQLQIAISCPECQFLGWKKLRFRACRNKFLVHECVIFQTLCYYTGFTTTQCQNYIFFASKCPSKPKFWSNLLLHHQCLEPPTVKTTAIWMESEKLGQICNVFQDPKYSLALLRLFPDLHSTINKQGYSGGTSSDIVILVWVFKSGTLTILFNSDS